MTADSIAPPATGTRPPEPGSPGSPDDGSRYRSPLLAVAGAVPAAGADLGVADHYGDPLREQRVGEHGAVVVDRSHRGVLRITGVDRLSWLHSITSQHLAALPAMRGSEALVLSPHGHVEHHLMIADDGTATWLDVEPGTSTALLAYLESMRFLLRVEPVDVHADHAVLSVLGPAAVDVVASAFAPLDPPLHRPARRDVTVGYDGDLLARGPYPLARALVRPAPPWPAPPRRTARWPAAVRAARRIRTGTTSSSGRCPTASTCSSRAGRCAGRSNGSSPRARPSLVSARSRRHGSLTAALAWARRPTIGRSRTRSAG
ncbi:hypothetical protein [Protofrankia symbiont of Coriaria myrtifolia]|uniref:hypothetical protein n=1 Tax=Protofrankia symbiont of Coriaria myrtifolia TaxID=1306540 RepID=UPI001F5ED9F4|nr:hypothetical protein [Protofrankia symbiont of Coriaria myrtifolia]